MTPDEIDALLRKPTLFIDELARVLRCSTDTISRRLKRRSFPIKPLPRVDARWRWATSDVRAYLRIDK